MAILDLAARACMGAESGASSWAVLQHVPYETPGLIETVARARGLEIDCRYLYRGDAVPNLDELVGLVVLGGPMGVRDVEEYPHLRAEIDLIAAALAADRPVLGVCLGAQLLAQALGADVLRGSMTEVGLGSVALTPAGEGDPVLGPAGRWLPVLHWHQDTFTVPADADLLASSRRYENQAFRVGRAYGFQFHVELDQALVENMQEHLPDGVELPPRHVRRIERMGTVAYRPLLRTRGRGARASFELLYAIA